MSFPDSIKGWQGTWFYCRDVHSGPNQSGLPPYSTERVRAPESLLVAKEEKTEVGILATALVGVVNDMDLLETFLARWIQPLQARYYPMWMYEGPSDPTLVHPKELDEKDVVCFIAKAPSTLLRLSPRRRSSCSAKSLRRAVSPAAPPQDLRPQMGRLPPSHRKARPAPSSGWARGLSSGGPQT